MTPAMTVSPRGVNDRTSKKPRTWKTRALVVVQEKNTMQPYQDSEIVGVQPTWQESFVLYTCNGLEMTGS